MGAFEYKEIILAPWFKQYEYLGDPSTRLDEEDEGFQIHVHARPWESFQGDADYDFYFDAVIDFDYDKMDGEEFLDVEYRNWIKVFKESFPDDELYYPKPDEYL